MDRLCPGCGQPILPDDLAVPAVRGEPRAVFGSQSPATSAGKTVAVHPDCFPPNDGGEWVKLGEPMAARLIALQ